MGCLTLTILGGTFEVTGFMFIAWEIARIQREEFGTPQIVLRARAWIDRVILRRPVKHAVSASVSIPWESGVSAKGYAIHPPGPSLEERVDALEKSLSRTQEELRERASELAQRIGRVEEQQQRMRADLDEQLQQREHRRKASLRTTITLQSVGTSLFVVGAFLSVLGNAVTC